MGLRYGNMFEHFRLPWRQVTHLKFVNKYVLISFTFLSFLTLASIARLGLGNYIDPNLRVIWTLQVIIFLSGLGAAISSPKEGGWLERHAIVFFLTALALLASLVYLGHMSSLEDAAVLSDPDRKNQLGTIFAETSTYLVVSKFKKLKLPLPVQLKTMAVWFLLITTMAIFELLLFAFFLPSGSSEFAFSELHRNIALLAIGGILFKASVESITSIRVRDRFWQLVFPSILIGNLSILMAFNGIAEVCTLAPGLVVLTVLGAFVAWSGYKPASRLT